MSPRAPTARSVNLLVLVFPASRVPSSNPAETPPEFKAKHESKHLARVSTESSGFTSARRNHRQPRNLKIPPIARALGRKNPQD